MPQEMEKLSARRAELARYRAHLMISDDRDGIIREHANAGVMPPRQVMRPVPQGSKAARGAVAWSKTARAALARSIITN